LYEKLNVYVFVISEENSTKGTKTKRKFTIFRRNRDDKKPQGKLFGRLLADVTTPESLVAKPVRELLSILFREGPFTVGILRKSANARSAKELKQRLDDGEDCLTNETWQSLVIGSILKVCADLLHLRICIEKNSNKLKNIIFNLN